MAATIRQMNSKITRPRVKTTEITQAQAASVNKINLKTELDTEYNDKYKILVVDDESINRLVIVNYLGEKDYQIMEAKSGMQALDLMQSIRFDLILLDIMMPAMTGYDVCETVRKHFNGNELPIIFLTAKSQIEDMVESFSLGGNDYLIKPICQKELLARVQTHLQLHRFYRQGEKDSKGLVGF